MGARERSAQNPHIRIGSSQLIPCPPGQHLHVRERSLDAGESHTGARDASNRESMSRSTSYDGTRDEGVRGAGRHQQGVDDPGQTLLTINIVL